MDITGTLPPPPRLAVVGSRATSSPYLRATREVVAAAAHAGWSVISGGALGVDAEAHRASLDLQVPTLAVLPLRADAVGGGLLGSASFWALHDARLHTQLALDVDASALALRDDDAVNDGSFFCMANTSASTASILLFEYISRVQHVSIR